MRLHPPSLRSPEGFSPDYKILANRTHLGEAVHKGKSYPGEHEPIVDRTTWDRVHEVLAANAKRRGQRGARQDSGAAS